MIFQYGNFILHSGQKSNFKIDCEQYSEDDFETFARMIASTINFDSVFGIPKGGSILQNKLEPYRSSFSRRLLIVDDVYTTGKSMEETKTFYSNINKGLKLNLWDEIKGVVIYARTETPDWIFPIFKLHANLRNK